MFANLLSAQADCAGGRYQSEIFAGFDLTSDITYGSNINLAGQTQSLELDIYEPTGDNFALRPIIVMEHGGSFVGGSKDQVDITSLAQPLAKMGYVVASVEYRLGMEGLPFPGPGQGEASESVWRAVADMKAAVRFLYKSAANGNPYGIDTNRIYVGGVSAGAVSAVHYAYLADLSEMPSYIDTTKAGLGGGIEGSSGNPGYSSKVYGVVNICGMLADTAWMDANEPPIVSLHGTDDQVVPYGTDMITVGGFFPIFVVDGSASVTAKANELGIDNCFFPHYGAPHTPHINTAAYLDTTLVIVSDFVHHLACNEPAACSYLVSVDPGFENTDMSIYPNPAFSAFIVEFDGVMPATWDYQLMDVTGRIVEQGTESGVSRMEVKRDGLASGMYIFRVTSENFTKSERIIFE